MRTYAVTIRIDVDLMAVLIQADSKKSALVRAKSLNIGKPTAIFECVQKTTLDGQLTDEVNALDKKIMEAESEVENLKRVANIESSIAAYQRYVAARDRLLNLQTIKGGDIYA